jgi:hypothetical protein
MSKVKYRRIFELFEEESKYKKKPQIFSEILIPIFLIRD